MPQVSGDLGTVRGVMGLTRIVIRLVGVITGFLNSGPVWACRRIWGSQGDHRDDLTGV